MQNSGGSRRENEVACHIALKFHCQRATAGVGAASTRQTMSLTGVLRAWAGLAAGFQDA
jgi:hypothetical protein